MNRTWKIALALAGIFLAGGLTGALLSIHLARVARERRMDMEAWGPRQLRRWQADIGLDKAQVEKMRPIVEKAMDESRTIRRDAMEKAGAILSRMEADVAALMTPEQKAKFEQIQKEAKERRREIMRQHRREHPHPPFDQRLEREEGGSPPEGDMPMRPSGDQPPPMRDGGFPPPMDDISPPPLPREDGLPPPPPDEPVKGQ